MSLIAIEFLHYLREVVKHDFNESLLKKKILQCYNAYNCVSEQLVFLFFCENTLIQLNTFEDDKKPSTMDERNYRSNRYRMII